MHRTKICLFRFIRVLRYASAPAFALGLTCSSPNPSLFQPAPPRVGLHEVPLLRTHSNNHMLYQALVLIVAPSHFPRPSRLFSRPTTSGTPRSTAWSAPRSFVLFFSFSFPSSRHNYLFSINCCSSFLLLRSLSLLTSFLPVLAAEARVGLDAVHGAHQGARGVGGGRGGGGAEAGQGGEETKEDSARRRRRRTTATA